jgi:hypothetical protein
MAIERAVSPGLASATLIGAAIGFLLWGTADLTFHRVVTAEHDVERRQPHLAGRLFLHVRVQRAEQVRHRGLMTR